MEDERTYTLEEAGEYLRMDRRSVRAEISRGKLKAFRAGRRILILASEMRAYEARQQVQPDEASDEEGDEDAPAEEEQRPAA